ncbi:MAG: bifunctional (p)ppGpp synthetase/guanosine-3',5'-bis(diphosphate) 3'-pyrophosphohydrolase [Chlamydiae bacterium]|nr:bifunctional (p)ppGpp synthetase/guanosine-3',5'-bis(diphosphate) 3'-pyrophosphohydrolase [Chlamydiota bacterium]
MKKLWILLLLCGLGLGSAVVAQGKEKGTRVEQSYLSEEQESVIEHIKTFAKNNQTVMKQLTAFLSSLQKGVDQGELSAQEAKKVRQAAVFAAQKHKDQLKKNKEQTPYIVHPLGVAEQIMRIGGSYDADILIAALLHDSIENTDTTYEEIEQKFGSKVAGYVREVTEDQTLPLKVRKKLQIIHAFHQSQGATLIKLSDKLHNLHTLMVDPPAGWSQDKTDQYFQWAQAVIDNLPESNLPLKEAVHKEIAGYWEMQEKK